MHPPRSARSLATVLILALAFLAVALAGGSLTSAHASDIPTPTPTAPTTGIEAPLGRYLEPSSSSERDAQSAPSLQSGAKAPAMGTNFNGIGMEPDRSPSAIIYTPPDTNSATGLDRIVEVTNGHVAIYNKSGGLISGGDTGAAAVELNDFCAPVIATGCFDPKVIYDQPADRFVAVVLDGDTSSNSWLHIMVSKTSSPANLTTDWDKFVHSASTTISSTAGWFDYPGLGVSPDAVVVTGNIFPDSGIILGTKIRVFDKAELYDGDATATFVDIDTTGASGGFTIQPAHHLSSPPSGTFYLLQSWNSTFLRLVALTGVPASPVVNSSLVSTANQGGCVSDAPQQGTSKKIDTLCFRMMNAVYRSGSVWGTNTGSTGSRAVVQWYEIQTSGFPSGTPTTRQHGAIDAGTGENTFMPSISVDACDNAAVTYTQSSSSRFPEMRYTGRAAADTLNTMQSPVVAKTSVSFYDDFITDSPERWGDYSSTVIDPIDGSFWITHEYVRVAASGGGDDGRWGTWHANFSLSCQTFPDVPTDHWAWRFVEAIAAAGLTSGFPDGTYRPNNSVTRAEMAVFILRGINGSSFTPPPPSDTPVFSDIDGHWAEAWIEQLKNEGITGGFPDGTYRPNNNVTRAEMAIFLLKAEHGSAYTPPPPSDTPVFSDIDGHWAEAWIEQLKNEGITGGFPDGTYRPANTATRAEMAVFLVNTFGIPLP